MRTLTNFGTPASFRIQHLDLTGAVVETRLIFSTNAAKAHRKLREVLGWEDGVYAGDVFILETRKGSTWAETERYEVTESDEDPAEGDVDDEEPVTARALASVA